MRRLDGQSALSSLSPSRIGIVFSTFLTKELSTARNIKDRLNRQVVVRTLTRIREKLGVVRNTNGLIVFAGVDQYDSELMEIFDLKEGIRLDIFYYNCSKKFDVEFASKFLQQYDGTIVFANGNECMIYAFEGGSFQRTKHITANLQKRQRKGGMSSLRIARLAEESRHGYVVHVVDHLNLVQTKNNWLFGSEEIVCMILRNKALLTKMKNGGFLEFNGHTIKDQKKYLSYLQDNEASSAADLVLKDIQYYLDTNPDMLDFDIDNRENMKHYLLRDPSAFDLQSSKYVALPVSSRYYARLRVFPYIGVKYFTHDEAYLHEEDMTCFACPTQDAITEDISDDVRDIRL